MTAINDLKTSLDNPDDPWTQEFALIGYAIVELAEGLSKSQLAFSDEGNKEAGDRFVNG